MGESVGGDGWVATLGIRDDRLEHGADAGVALEDVFEFVVGLGPARVAGGFEPEVHVVVEEVDHAFGVGSEVEQHVGNVGGVTGLQDVEPGSLGDVEQVADCPACGVRVGE